MEPLYDAIGRGYALRRRPDPCIAQRLLEALGDCASVVNVGAGTGSYEPRDREVVAVEPSAMMIAQRPDDAAPVVQSSAERLPFADGTFDAAMAVLTIHHWHDLRAGLAEMKRVARRRIVLLTWDPASTGFWLTRDYFPEILEIDRKILPSLDVLRSLLGELTVHHVPIPHDCSDGFLGAYWRRPDAYLADDVRSAISTFSRIRDVPLRLETLRADLDDGTWTEANRDLMELDELDVGYRIVVHRIDGT